MSAGEGEAGPAAGDGRDDGATLFAGPGELRALCRAHDWAATPLGPVEGWPQSLRTTATTVLALGFPAIVLWGPDLVQLYNDGYVPFLGANHPGGLGQPTHACWPDLRPLTEPVYDRVWAGETVTQAEQVYPLRRRGPGAPPDEVAITLTFAPVRDEAGAVGGVFVTLLDVSAQVAGRDAQADRERLLAESEAARADAEQARAVAERAAAALAESEARFRAVQDASPDGSVLMRPERDASGVITDFTFVYANAAATHLIGAGAESLVGRTLCAAYPDSPTNGYLAGYVRAFESWVPFVVEEDHARFGRPVHLQMTAVRAGDLMHARFADVSAEVEARAERERLLGAERAARGAAEAEQRRLAAVIAHLPVGVTFAEAPAGRHSVSNPAAVAIWGVLPASAEVAAYSRDFVGFRPGPGERGSAEEAERRIASHEWPLARALGAGEVVVDELAEIERPDGTRRLVSLSAAPVRDADGQVTGALVTTIDVTEREATLRALDAARHAAESGNRAKGEFLAVMSHELRTPLNAIGGYAELIELGIHGPVTEAQRTALARIQQSQRHLLGLIAGVLDYSRVEAGAVSYRLTDVPVAEAVAEAETLVAPQLRAQGLGYAWSGAAPDLRVRADREKLQQILLNLLGNAVKFTHPRGGTMGRIEVSCTVVEGGGAGGPEGGHVRIHVRDTGQGIAGDELERVFEPFVQADQRLTRPHAGVGLGLAISRDLARGMGGELTAESTPGIGSEFTLTLPRA